MIHTFEYKLPLPGKDSFVVCRECGLTIPRWRLQTINEQEGYIEYKVYSLLGVPSYVRLYLRHQRPEYTLITIYINRPFRPIDPFAQCNKIYHDLKARLDQVATDTSTAGEKTKYSPE